MVIVQNCIGGPGNTVALLCLSLIFSLNPCHGDDQAPAQKEVAKGDLKMTFLYDKHVASDVDHNSVSVIASHSDATPVPDVLAYISRARDPQLFQNLPKLDKISHRLSFDGKMFSPRILTVAFGDEILVQPPKTSGSHAIHGILVAGFILHGGGCTTLHIAQSNANRGIWKYQCDSHSDRSEDGFVFIERHRWVGVSDRMGQLRISGIPVGQRRIKFWNESERDMKQIESEGFEIPLENGGLTVDVRENEVDEFVFILPKEPQVKPAPFKK